MRLRGLGLGRIGMEKLKNSHKGGVVRKFRTRHYSPALCKIEARSNGENFWLLRVGNAG